MRPLVFAVLSLLAQAASPTAPPASRPPSVAPSDGCANRFREASVIEAKSPEYPNSARKLKLPPASVLVEVQIGPDGSLQQATIYKSSGVTAIDQEALRAAQQSKYSSRIVNCEAVAARFLFRANFVTPDFVAPQFSPPSGWIKLDRSLGRSGGTILGTWSSPEFVATMILDGEPDTKSLDEVRVDYERSNSRYEKVLSSQATRICDGKQDAWELLIQPSPYSGGRSLLIFAKGHANDVESTYSLLIQASKARLNDPTITAAIDSFCVPMR